MGTNFFLLKPTSGNYSYLPNAPTDTIFMLLNYENQVGPNKGRRSSYKRGYEMLKS